MTTYNFGDVVVAKIRFSDRSIEKPRPAVVVSNATFHARKPDIIVASITSNVNCAVELGEFLIADLSAVRLKVPSRVKAFISTIDPDIIKYKIGQFSETDTGSLRIMLGKLFA